MEIFKMFGSIFIKDNDAAKVLDDIDKKAKNTGSGLSNLSKSFEGFGKKATEFGKKGLAISAIIGGLGVASFNMASDYNESLNKVDVAFKDNSAEVQEWSNTTLKNFGIAKGSALEMASLFGDMGTAMGLSTGDAANMSTSLVGLAGDLSSFKNVSLDVAQNALKGIFTGEGESLKSLGIIMQDTTLKEFALAQGIKKNYSEMTQSEKVQLRYKYVMEMTKNAQGDFANTSDGTANSMRIFQETLKELGTTLGQKLLPVITPIIQKITEWVQWFGSLNDSTQTTIIVIAGIVAAVAPLLMIIGSVASGIGALTALFAPLTVATTTATTATTGLNLAFLANPIGIVIASIVALVAAIAILWNKNEGFRNALIGAWNAIKTTAETVWNAIGNFFTKTIPDAFNVVLDFVKNNWQGLLLFIVNPIAGAVKLLYNLNPQFKAWVDNLIQGIKDWFGGIVQAGADLVSGLWNGISNSWNWLAGKIREWCGNIADAIKAFFGIHSPSTLMQEYGRYLDEGLAKGISDNQNMPISEAENMAQAISSAITTMIDNMSKSAEQSKADFELWSKTVGATASESEVLNKQLSLLSDEYTTQQDKVMLLEKAYQDMIAAKGEASKESKELLFNLTKERIAEADLANQIAETNRIKAEKATSAKKTAGSTWLNLLKQGNAVKEIMGWTDADVGKFAREKSGYDPSIPSYDVGTPYVPKDQLAFIHRGEAVIPAKYNNAKNTSATNKTEHVYNFAGANFNFNTTDNFNPREFLSGLKSIVLLRGGR